MAAMSAMPSPAAPVKHRHLASHRLTGALPGPGHLHGLRQRIDQCPTLSMTARRSSRPSVNQTMVPSGSSFGGHGLPDPGDGQPHHGNAEGHRSATQATAAMWSRPVRFAPVAGVRRRLNGRPRGTASAPGHVNQQTAFPSAALTLSAARRRQQFYDCVLCFHVADPKQDLTRATFLGKETMSRRRRPGGGQSRGTSPSFQFRNGAAIISSPS